ncbi:membrane protein implicated in regulation of membrane protease activity [Arthrobacter pascens]|nr:membrane protein implicated in regulation of membrane protease activity [Arthrobacter pascens]
MNAGGVSRPTMALGLAAIALSLVTLVGLPTPLQAVAAIAILVLLPGQALARLTPVTDLALGALLVLALGLAALTAVSTTMFYLAVWSWQACIITMGVITILACIARARQEATS